MKIRQLQLYNGIPFTWKDCLYIESEQWILLPDHPRVVALCSKQYVLEDTVDPISWNSCETGQDLSQSLAKILASWPPRDPSLPSENTSTGSTQSSQVSQDLHLKKWCLINTVTLDILHYLFFKYFFSKTYLQRTKKMPHSSLQRWGVFSEFIVWTKFWYFSFCIEFFIM